MCLAPQLRAIFRRGMAIESLKSSPSMWKFAHFDSKCASHHNGVHFFDISTSKSRPNPTCFDTFYLVLPNVLRATTATATLYSTSQLPKMVRDRRVLTLSTSKCASRRNGVHFFNILSPTCSSPDAFQPTL